MLPSDAIVVNKSTVPVGSTKVVERALQRPDVKVVSNPEFLREGSAVSDFLKPDRIVIGSEDQAAAIRVAALYLGITAPLIVTDPASAETIKYAANAFLATKVSFVNAVAAICEGSGPTSTMSSSASATTSASATSSSAPARLGRELPSPKDAVRWCDGRDRGYQFDLLQGVIAVNDDQRERILDEGRAGRRR